MTEYHLTTKFDFWPLTRLRRVLDALEVWCYENQPDATDVRLLDIWETIYDPSDPDRRVDMTILYRLGNRRIQQRLWMIGGRIIDGEEFHKLLEGRK